MKILRLIFSPLKLLLFFTLLISSVFSVHLSADGLTGRYYNNETFTNPVVMTRTDATIDFTWGSGNPGGGVNNNHFSTEWNGYIYFPEDANYIFSLAHDDVMTVTIDGTTIYDNSTWTGGSGNYNDTASIHYVSDYYPITIRFVEWGGGAYARFAWRNDAGIGSRTTVPASNLFTALLPLSPVAEYRFDEPSWNGTVNEVKDNISNNDGVSRPSTTGADTNSSAATGGGICRVGHFDGTEDYVDMGNAFNTLLGSSNDTFTITAWIKPEILTDDQSNHRTKNVFIAQASDGNNDNLEIGVNPDGSLHLYLDTTSGPSGDRADFGNGITTGSWHFIAVSYDGSDVKVTIDGTTTTNSSWSGNLRQANGSPFTVGTTRHSDIFFDGNVDEVKLFDTALTPTQINTIYTNESNGDNYDGTQRICSGTSPTAEYRFDECVWDGTPGDVIDTKGNHGGTSHNASTDSNLTAGGGLCRVSKLNGTSSYLEISDHADLKPTTFSIMTWIKPTGWNRWSTIIAKSNATLTNGYGIYHDDNVTDSIKFFVDGNTTTASTTASLNTWTHIAAIYDGTSLKIYKNGSLADTTAKIGITHSSNTLLIGDSAYGGIGSGNDFFTGYMDEMKFFDTNLSASAISNFYANELVKKEYDGNIRSCITCPEGYCFENLLPNGFHLVDTSIIHPSNPYYNNPEKTFEIFCYNFEDYIALPLKNSYNNFVFDNNALSTVNYYDEAENHSKSFNALKINTNTMDVLVDSADRDPLSNGSFDYMGSSFSNINLIGTPFAIDWDQTNITNCNESKLRKAYYGQAVKINSLDYTNAKCYVSNMKVKLLNDYKYLIHGGNEILEDTCKLMSETIPIDVMPSSAIKGHYWLSSSGNNRSHDNTDITSKERPIVAYCWFQEDLNWAWTFVLAMDGKVTINRSDLAGGGSNTCYDHGLWPFVPKDEESFERVRKFLYDSIDEWSAYTGTINEKIAALHSGNNYYLSTERNSLIWPYGSFGVYYNRDTNRTWGGEDTGSNTHHPGPMSGSPMHNIPSITYDYNTTYNDPFNPGDPADPNRDYYDMGQQESDGIIDSSQSKYSASDTSASDKFYEYKDTMGAKGWVSILGFSAGDLQKTNDWFISRAGAGVNFDHTSGSHPYYEPNGNYTAGAWLNFLFDSKGYVRHNDDWGANYPYYDYMCIAEDNYEFVNRGYTPAGVFNVVRTNSGLNNQGDIDPLPEDFDPINDLYTQISDKNSTLRVVALEDVNATNPLDSYKLLKNYNGVVKIDYIEEPEYLSAADEPDSIIRRNANQRLCDNASKLPYSISTHMPFSNSSISDFTANYTDAHRKASFRITYVAKADTNLSAIHSTDTCNDYTYDCIWGILEPLYHQMNGSPTYCQTNGYPSAECPCALDGGGANLCKPTVANGSTQASAACLTCIFETDIHAYACARDGYAIRPDVYDLSIGASNIMQLKAKQSYTLDINATRYGATNPALDYDTTIDNNSSLKSARKVLIVPPGCNTADLSDLVDTNMTLTFEDGESNISNFTYPNVGDINITISDSNWTYYDHNGKAVDPNDPSRTDCIENSSSNTPDANGKIGCDLNTSSVVKFIPDRFDSNMTLSNHSNGFTYVSDNRSMTAPISVRIRALAIDGNVTTNYTAGCYADDINYTLSLVRDQALGWSSTQGRALFFDDENVTSRFMSTHSPAAEFNSTEGNFTQGIADINLSMNFDRDSSIVDEPFHITKNSDLNISVENNESTIKGEGFGTSNDQNATFYYGRVFAPYYAFTINPGTATIYYEVYCKDCNQTTYNITALTKTVDNNNEWYQNSWHTSMSDGNVSNNNIGDSYEPIGSAIVNVSQTTAGSFNGDGTESINLTAPSVPYKDRIQMHGSPWLIYNQYNPATTVNDFEVEWFGKAGWAGRGDLGKTVDENVSQKTNRRVDW